MRRDPINLSTAVELPAYDFEWEKNVPYLFNTLPIVIEYLAGDTRTKKSGSGFVVSSVMPAAYGCILRTNDIHGEEIDIYLAPMANKDATVFVIDQINPASKGFDEHKVMLGFGSSDEATQIYYSVFGDGSGKERLGAISSFTFAEFMVWLTTDGALLKPAADYSTGSDNTQRLAGIAPAISPHQTQAAPRDQAGGVLVEMEDLSKGPKIKTVCQSTDASDYHLYMYAGLDCKVWSNTVDTFCRILDFARPTDKVHIHIACPGGSVFLMGRLISAMARTKAHVITYAEGCVASAATTTWAAGHERYILPGAYFMQHMSSQLLSGKSTDISAKARFCVDYINNQLKDLLAIGLFTAEEVSAMGEKECDINISGREAINRVGAHSVRA